MTQRWIVTGANGYVGGEICRQLASQGLEVHGFARTGRAIQELEGAGVGWHRYEHLTEALIEGDVIVHCAGKVGDKGRFEDFVKVNVDWTLSLFRLAAEKGASCFVYISSVAAVGYKNRTGIEVLDEESVPLLSDGELYGRSKWLAEQALQEEAGGGKTRLVILRPGLIYGRRSFAKHQTWFRRGIVIAPDQRLPLVHIDSLCDAIIRIVEKPDVNGAIFFVVDDEQPSLHELDALRIEHGMLQYHRWCIGDIGFWLLSALRFAVSVLRRGQSAIPKGYTRAQYYFATRRLRYSTEKLRNACQWMPAIDLVNGLISCCIDSHNKEMRMNAHR